MIIIIILAITLLLFFAWLVSKPYIAPSEEGYCESCRYCNRNCTQDPCIICDGGSEWQKSTLDGQEEFDG